MSRKPLTIEIWPIDRLVPDPRNYRGHPERQRKHIQASLEAFALRKPIVARPSDGRIVAGHGIYETAKAMGWTEIEVAPWECTDAQASKFLVADNEIARLADDDKDALAELLGEIRDLEGSLLGTGWDNDDLETLLAENDRRAKATKKRLGYDDAPEPRRTVPSLSRVGEVYQLGPHKLICGDAQDPAVWSALMGDERADLCWTDPPFGVGYAGGDTLLSPSERTDAGGQTLENDTLDPDDLERLLRAAFTQMLQCTRPGGVWYVKAPSRPIMLPFAKVLAELKVWRQMLVWEKEKLVPGRADYQYRHENLFYGWKPGGAHKWYGDRKQDTLREFDRPARNDMHPSMTPLALIQDAVKLSSKVGDTVVDAFAGSGSTLIAADCEARVARVIELDPWYADVIRRRWRQHCQANGIDPGEGALDD